ncbi:MAG: dioxygenase [Paraglaciecola sp.]|nr:dioxygenase [Paraglaciecola sp.]
MSHSSELMPVLYLPHGAGPMPLLGEPGHANLVTFLRDIPQRMPVPKAIIMISAHWESNEVRISSSPAPDMMYDYGGFPPETYEYRYDAPGNPELAQTISSLLANKGIASQLDEHRGFDHGTFVPLMLMYPLANIPVVQVSLLKSFDPAKHIKLGEALAPLREQGILIVGSGMSFHGRAASKQHSIVFDEWLTSTLLLRPVEQTSQRLLNWEAAPAARYCHAREEHLMPLHVCFGAAKKHSTSAEKVFSGWLFDRQISAFLWH